MPASFTLQFFDLMVHLIPGTILLTTAARLASAHGHLPAEAFPGPVLLLPLGFVAAFVVGFLVQLATSATVGLFEHATGRRILDTYVAAQERREALDAARTLAATTLHMETRDAPSAMDFYRYAEVVVEEAMPRNHLRASRVQALSLFSRNLIPVSLVVAASLVLFDPGLTPLGRWAVAGTGALAAMLFYYGFTTYWRRSIDVTLWAFGQWARRPSLGTPATPDPKP